MDRPDINQIIARHKQQLAIQSAASDPTRHDMIMNGILAKARDRQSQTRYLNEAKSGQRDFSFIKNAVQANLDQRIPGQMQRQEPSVQAGIRQHPVDYGNTTALMDQILAPARARQAMAGPGLPFDKNFDTILTPQQEQGFQQWRNKYVNPLDKGLDYDLRGAYMAGLKPAGPEAGPDEGHFPDTYKKPSHPTFSDESRYAAFGNPGFWGGVNRDVYIPPTTSKGFPVATDKQRQGFPTPEQQALQEPKIDPVDLIGQGYLARQMPRLALKTARAFDSLDIGPETANMITSTARTMLNGAPTALAPFRNREEK